MIHQAGQFCNDPLKEARTECIGKKIRGKRRIEKKVRGEEHHNKDTKQGGPRLELVVVLVELGNSGLESLPGSDGGGKGLELGSLLDGGTRHERPVVEARLRESLSTSGGSEIGVESERLGDGKVSLHGEHGGTDSLLGRVDVSSSNVEARLDKKETDKKETDKVSQTLR